MKQRNAPNWDEYGGRAMTIPFFVYGRADLDVGPLVGFCRGHGGISGDEKRYQDKIGIYTAEGVYYNVLVDVRVKSVMPQFFIDGKPFFYPIVACYTICGGLPVIDPATGNMRTPHEKAASEDRASQEGLGADEPGGKQ
jgi:hypothetical protein